MGSAVGPWDDLAREWDLWRAAGRTPDLWWRDDDAVAATPALQELQRAARTAPLALAVIPMAIDRPLEQSLAAALAGWPTATVLQHGVGHLNHGEGGAKKSEFPATRPESEIRLALTIASTQLQNIFGQQFLPVLTPPWNRLSDNWLSLLPQLGFRGLTRFSEPPFKPRPVVADLRQIDTVVDVIDWRGSRGFVGLEAALGRLVWHLAARRQGQAEADMPTGILTHHLVHDTATWRFLDNLQDWLAQRGEGTAFQPPSALWPRP